jgi:hypothetical protein
VQVRYLTRPLVAPVRPLLPSVRAEDLMCLTPDTYRRVVQRDRMRRNYAEELEAIIRSTHAEASDAAPH